LIVETPIQPAGRQTSGRLHDAAAPPCLLFFLGSPAWTAANRGASAAVPAELGDHDRFAGGRRLARDDFQVRQIPLLVFLRVLEKPGGQGIEVDLHEIQKRRLALRSESGVVLHGREQGRDAPLDEPHGDKRFGVRCFDRRRLTPGPVVGDLFTKVLVVEQWLGTQFLAWRWNLFAPANAFRLDTPGFRELLCRSITRMKPLAPVGPHRRRTPRHRRLVPQIIGKDDTSTSVATGQ